MQFVSGMRRDDFTVGPLQTSPVRRTAHGGGAGKGRAARSAGAVVAAILLEALPLACGGGNSGAGQGPAAQPPGVAVCEGGTNPDAPCPGGDECTGGGSCVAAATCDGGTNPGTPCPTGTECLGGGLCPDVRLAPDEVRALMESAARALDTSQFQIAVAVSDRRGVVLGVGTNFPIDYDANCTAACVATDTPVDSPAAVVDRAVQLARTAAFFSADQTPLTSRSVRFLSGEHFPPNIRNTAAAALFGIENTNRGCAFDAVTQPLADTVPRAQNLCAVLAERAGTTPMPCESGSGAGDQCGCSDGILTLPGGVPVYRYGRMAGGVGVAVLGAVPQPDPIAAFPPGSGILRFDDNLSAFNAAEFAARAFTGFAPAGLPSLCADANVDTPACCSADPACDLFILPARNLPFAPVIFVDGVEIPEVATNPPAPRGAGTFGRCAVSLGPCRVDGDPCPLAGESCAAITTYIVDPASLNPADPLDSAQPVPQGWLVGPFDASPGAQPLSAAEVADIINAGLREANRVRAAIRLPLEVRTKMLLAVSDTNNALLGLYRMQDATVFSIDVAVAKSRNVTYFSSPTIIAPDMLDCPGVGDCRGAAFPPGTALTNRTLGFGAQPFFPSGIEGHLDGFPNPFAPGPFRQTFIDDSNHPCSNGQQPADGRQNGIVFFPGSMPLYRGGTVIGGFGVSGDGVEQDDLVSFDGGQVGAQQLGFLPPPKIRADQRFVRGVRLPFVKFNRRPDQ